MAKLNGQNGHWYTSENGQHYFVAEGQTPKEGWEATKRRKRINNGKYELSEDEGKSWKESDKDAFDKFEAEDAEFDNDDVDSLEKENSIFKGLTDLGRKTMKEANEAGWGEAYDPMTGDISISEKDFAGRKQDIQSWLDNHKDYKLVEDQIGGKWLTTDYENGEKELSLDDNVDERDLLKTGDTAYYNGKKVTISTSGRKDNELGGIQLKARDEAGHVYELSSRQLDKDEPTSPMDEFSGPDREGPSYAQLDAMKTDKNGNKYLEFDSDKEAKEYFNNNDLPDGTVMYGNKIYFDKKSENRPSFDIEKHNRMVGLESQMHSLVDNARKNGQSPQQILDSVSYDMDIEPNTEEFNRLKNIVMYDTRMNKDTGEYEYNRFNVGSNKLLSKPEDREKINDLRIALQDAGLQDAKIEDGYEDYGANMKWTNITSGDTWVLNPKDWMDYMNGNATKEEIVDRVKNDKYKDVFKWKDMEKNDESGITPEFDDKISKAFGYLGGKGRPDRKDGYDYIAEEFDYDNKIYHNLDEHAKYLEDRIKDLDASAFAKDNPAWAEERRKEYQSQLDFIRNNKDRLQKYVDDSNATHRRRVTGRSLRAIRNIDDLKRQYKNGSITIDDIRDFLDRE